jgi:hypothetical protein
MNSPDYSYPPGLFPNVALDIILLRHRDFHKDAKASIENLKPPLQVLGGEIFHSRDLVSSRSIINVPGLCSVIALAIALSFLYLCIDHDG